MNRAVVVLLSVLIATVAGHGILVWRAAVVAHDDAERESCLQRAEATAVIALLAPADRVDTDGRLAAMETLGAQVDDC